MLHEWRRRSVNRRRETSFLFSCPQVDPKTPIEESMRAMKDLKAEGKACAAAPIFPPEQCVW